MPAIRGNINNEVGRNKMAKSRRKKNYKLRRRVMRTIAALTMIMAIVVAAIPVENLGMVQADNSRALGDISGDLNNSQDTPAEYSKVKYEDSFSGGTAIVQRIVETDGGGSFIDVFEVKKKSSGSEAMIIRDIIGDGFHGSETALTINGTEYCDYVQFDSSFIEDITDALANGSFELSFNTSQQQTSVPNTAPSSSNLAAVSISTIRVENPTSTSVNVSISNDITNNQNAHGYTDFSTLSNLDSKKIYEQEFGKAIYDERVAAINAYNQDASTLQGKIDAFVARVTGSGYQWQGRDTTEWNDFINQSNALTSRLNSLQKLTTTCDGFSNADNGLNNIVDYIIRNYCRNGSTKNLLDFRLKGLSKTNAAGENESVYVPQLKEGGNYTGQLDDKKYLAASTSVLIRGIASYDQSASPVFYGTHLRSISLPQGITFIGKTAFGKSNLDTVTINATTCEIIGEEAFADSSKLKSVNFTFGDGTTTGSNSFMTIDKKAFYSTAITSVKIPYSVKTVGAGAFANAVSLTEVEFEDGGRSDNIAIKKYAFYDCTALTKVDFPENSTKQYQIEKGAFALANQGGQLTEFKFPGGNTDIIYDTGNNAEDKYDFILANRKTLATVRFPGLLKSKIPDNTLSGCSGLSYVLFPEGAKSATYEPEALFVDVWNSDFYVEGPETLNTVSSYAEPRKTTWKAKAGKTGNDTWALTSVPYKFTDKDGKVHFEIGVSDEDGNLKYIANIEEIDKANKLASLISFFLYDQSGTPDHEWIKIPTTVGEYKIVSIEEGCFDDAQDLKNNVTKLSIGDAITDIKAGAFKDMPALQWVEIGSGVKNIESEAFAGCKELENVVFSQALTSTWNEENVEYWQELKIAGDAFKTNSKHLTFHGAIHPEYAPFKMAMSPNNSELLSGDAQICYKTDAPLNLTVIRNRADGKATLVNYPHYEDMDSDDRQLFEEIYIDATKKPEELNTDAARTILQSLKMELPSGIESIDTKSFFDTKSGNEPDHKYISWQYVQQKKNQDGTDSQVKSDYEWEEITDKTVNSDTLQDKTDLQSLYSLDGAAYVEDEPYASNIGDTAYVNNDPEKDRIVSTGGLFSGGFKETTQADQTDPTKGVIWEKPYEGHTYREAYTSGNDYLTSIDMRGVKELPKYAFDSCENLLTVAFNAVEEMDDLPFRGCKNLHDINTGATRFAFENLLLYEMNDDGTSELVECLEGRGQKSTNGHYYYTGSITGTGEEGANVDSMISTITSIREGAFSNCKDITTVDLNASKADRIPQRAFENCTSLWQVKLPETVRSIDQNAFKGAADRELYLEIKNPDCTISTEAFDFKTTNEVFIKGISTNYKGEESISHLNYEQIKKELKKSGLDENRIHWSELGSTCILTFEDEIGNIIKTIEIDKGATLENPPTAPEKSGYKFDYWICTGVRDENGNPLTGEATYSNVTEDRTIRAIYKEDPTTIVPDGKDYNLTVANGKAMIGGTLVSTFPTTIKGGTPVTIMANDEANFKVWTIEPGTYISLLLNASSPATSFTMPNADITVTANTAIGGGTDTPNPDGTYKVTVNNGTGSGNYRPGATVTITANTPPAGQTFVNWTTTTADVKFASATTATTTFVMPAANVNVTANFSGGNGGNNNNPGGDGNNPGGSDSGKKYKVTVNYGSGSGEYAAGATVNITANAPESSSRVFSRWTTNNSGLGFANANSVSTSFVMPAADVTVTANYKTRSSDDDDDDDDGPSRRPGTNTSTSTVPNRPSSSTSTTGTNGTVNNPASGTTTNNNGNRIYITKNGISNTDVASLAVSGSTDNFIVRITESPEATAAVEQSLTNTYGSLNGLAYLPMDISLYDSTGQNKITDSTGLNITVTMPIPDVLIQYGGNARVAAADNGNLQQITPRFTTIDGIACVSFVPPHFSPYVIYVDTNNLIAGQMLDATPATGDPIHPKWFAAIGMACASILMFVLSDGRKRRKYRAA